MKKILNMFLVSIILLVIGIINVNATALTNEEILLQQGSQELIDLYNEQPFKMSSEWFDDDGNLEEIVVGTVKYIETSVYVSPYSRSTTEETQRELTSEEYKNWTKKQTRSDCGSGVVAAGCWETNAKRLFVVYQNNPHKILVVNQWKSIPSVKSFDTIGILYNNYNMSSASGRQWYNTRSNTSEQYIDYGYQGTNMKISTNGQKGLSISQNIIDSVYSLLQNDLYLYGTDLGNLQVAASYQHAVKDINLETSKNFTFGTDGMGRVFKWNSSWSNWDNMQGVCFNWSNYLWAC